MSFEPSAEPRARRSAAWEALGARTFDLLVIGGGITGCGIAREARLRGLDVALVEKNDFASGTSSRSSRLIHGGVRYLEHGHFRLVFEASHERRLLLQLAPHLVQPLEFTWPVYAGARVARWKLDAGLLLYDMLAVFHNVMRHRRLSRQEIVAREPKLAADGLRGGASYYDAITDDARLTLANALDAAEFGAVILNHAAVPKLLTEGVRVTGAHVVDQLSDKECEVRARVVVNATGPWSDTIQRLTPGARRAAERGPEPSVRGSKGVHIALPRERVGNTGALTLLSPTDGRVFFILPHGEHTVVGTTDTYTGESADDVRATRDDVRYLLDAANSFYPDAHLDDADVIAAWAGIRPLVPSESDSPTAVSREHMVTSADGIVSITGGKLTTYRVMAEDVLKAAAGQLGRAPANAAKSKRAPLHGGAMASLDAEIAAAEKEMSDGELAGHLVRSHGTKWRDVWQAITGGADGKERLVADGAPPYTLGELRYSVLCEHASTLGDLLIRRTRVAFETRDHGASIAPVAAHALAPLLGWDASQIAAAVAAFNDEAHRLFDIRSM